MSEKGVIIFLFIKLLTMLMTSLPFFYPRPVSRDCMEGREEGRGEVIYGKAWMGGEGGKRTYSIIHKEDR